MVVIHILLQKKMKECVKLTAIFYNFFYSVSLCNKTKQPYMQATHPFSSPGSKPISPVFM